MPSECEHDWIDQYYNFDVEPNVLVQYCACGERQVIDVSGEQLELAIRAHGIEKEV